MLFAEPSERRGKRTAFGSPGNRYYANHSEINATFDPGLGDLDHQLVIDESEMPMPIGRNVY